MHRRIAILQCDSVAIEENTRQFDPGRAQSGLLHTALASVGE
jgi:hypothetical protein